MSSPATAALLGSGCVYLDPLGKWWHPPTETFLDHQKAVAAITLGWLAAGCGRVVEPSLSIAALPRATDHCPSIYLLCRAGQSSMCQGLIAQPPALL
eukprot:15440033-Alexandrium_andersonii.AAC.1